MEIKGESYISLKYKREDYLYLRVNKDPQELEWEILIDIEKDRFKSRYFEPINNLLNSAEQNGFAIMAINCLLVDAFYQFENGLKENPKKNVGENYCTFLETYLNELFDKDSAKAFYKYIRCGILHQAQTKNGSFLTVEGDCILYNEKDDTVKVNVVKFSDAMIKYFEGYITRLENGNQIARDNLIKKMDSICRLPKAN